jgi:ubiquinone/menaquinone biosynthesis C-methylase UbiE
MRSLSFDSMVRFYDETRVFDKRCFDSALDYLVKRFAPRAFYRVLEPGIGTGRIAIPLAERGYHVTGIDISQEMLAILEKRISGRPLRISYQEADATALPFPEAAFDIAVVVHLFYFIQKWRRAADEMLRVVTNSGPVVLMHTGMGTEISFLNDRYKELCAEHGCPIRPVGVRSTREVVGYFTSLGCRAEWIRDRWRWTSYTQLDKALSYIRSRAYSFTTFAPDDVHSMAIERLESELRDRFGSLTTTVETSNQVYMVLILRDDSRE